jgi:hypothetical protein
MLAEGVFTVVGIVAIATAAGYLVTPLLFYLTQAILYLLALTVVLLRATLTFRLTPKDVLNVFPQLLCKFRKYANSPIYESRNREDGSQYPKPVYESSPPIVARRIYRAKIGTESHRTNYYPAKKNACDMLKQPAVEKISKAVHSVLLFYKSFYGHSTKVEKNRLNIPAIECLGLVLPIVT